jgi:hypothetical protein
MLYVQTYCCCPLNMSTYKRYPTLYSTVRIKQQISTGLFCEQKLCEILYCNIYCYNNCQQPYIQLYIAMFIYTAILHYYVTIHYKCDTVHVYVFFFLLCVPRKIRQWKLIIRKFVKCFRKKRNKTKLFVDLKRARFSVRKDVLCNFLIEFGINMKLLSQRSVSV